MDTSALYAVMDADDEYHETAAVLWRQLLSRRDVFLITSNYVLVETSALVQRRLDVSEYLPRRSTSPPQLRPPGDAGGRRGPLRWAATAFGSPAAAREDRQSQMVRNAGLAAHAVPMLKPAAALDVTMCLVDTLVCRCTTDGRRVEFATYLPW